MKKDEFEGELGKQTGGLNREKEEKCRKKYNFKNKQQQKGNHLLLTFKYMINVSFLFN